jgi:hypothetical protein
MDHRDLALSIRRANILGGSWQDVGHNTLSLIFIKVLRYLALFWMPGATRPVMVDKLLDQGSERVKHALCAVLCSIRDILDEPPALINGFVANGRCQAGGEIFLGIPK